ncbi:MAG: GGDEF domain-containing protein [Butyrivibrio sp.]|nr:GGDEF domain-containing protein [Butyrivibrio sp.]
MVNGGPVRDLSFRIAAVMVSLTCLFYTAVMRTGKNRRLRSRLFDALIIITLIGCVTSIGSEIAVVIHASRNVRFFVSYICKYLYYMTHFLLIPVFWVYIMIVCDVYNTLAKRRLIFKLIPVIAIEIIILSNPFTRLIFSWDDNFRYYRGPAIYIVYLVSGIYLFSCFYLLAKYWNSMHIIQKVALFYFLGLAITGTIVQMLFPDVQCELMTEAMGFLGVMIMIENEDSRNDYKTSARNKTALVHDLKSALLVKKEFNVICVRVVNAEAYRRITGYENYDLILTRIADFLIGLGNEYETYRTTGGHFFLVCPEATQDEISSVLLKIRDRFEDAWDISNGSMNIKVKIFCVKCPEEFDNVDDILLLSEADIDETDKILYRGADLDFILRRMEVDKAIVRGINEDNFRVLYRPVYHKASRSIVSAEALLTLKDSVLGEVHFSEFNAAAQKSDFSVELQYRMTDAAIKFLKMGLERSKEEGDIRVLAIHIISVQVLKNDFAGKVKELVEKYEVNPRDLVIDVSDTIVMQAPDVIDVVEDQFLKMGINFFLINDEAGFLGLNPSSMEKFKGVVINVGRHYRGIMDDKVDMMLRNRCAMIKELGKDLIFTGIDTKELYERVKDLPADLVSGDFLSGKVSKNELQVKFWHKEVFYDGG